MHVSKLSILVTLVSVCSAQQSIPAPPLSVLPEASFPELTRPTAPVSFALTLEKGTPVSLIFAQAVSSRSAHPGEMIEFSVAEDVKVGDTVVIRKGARSIGYIADTVSAGAVGKGGALEIRMEAVRVRGQMVKLRGSDSREEKRATGKVVGMTVLFGLSGFLMAGGHDVKIPEGTPMTAYVAETVELPLTNTAK